MYDALSVIQAIGLAEKHGKVYVWVGRPSISSSSEDKPVSGEAAEGNIQMLSRMERMYEDKRRALIQLVRRVSITADPTCSA